GSAMTWKGVPSSRTFDKVALVSLVALFSATFTYACARTSSPPTREGGLETEPLEPLPTPAPSPLGEPFPPVEGPVSSGEPLEPLPPPRGPIERTNHSRIPSTVLWAKQSPPALRPTHFPSLFPNFRALGNFPCGKSKTSSKEARRTG